MGSSAEAGFRPGHRDRRRWRRDGLYKPRTLKNRQAADIKCSMISVPWAIWYRLSSWRKISNFQICAQNSLIFTTLHDRPATFGVLTTRQGLRWCPSTAVRMVAQHAVRDALVHVIDARPGFEQGIVLFALPLCASTTRIAFCAFLPRLGSLWDTGAGQ